MLRGSPCFLPPLLSPPGTNVPDLGESLVQNRLRTDGMRLLLISNDRFFLPDAISEAQSNNSLDEESSNRPIRDPHYSLSLRHSPLLISYVP
ncbi:Uncharacterized protein HZ326_3806 [Fusarium oxysporum f. sp. albedinis]|nr:Uncharacterized protein HZ326_3806 [Fusarium oxysporum f. sp. albedinis]